MSDLEICELSNVAFNRLNSLIYLVEEDNKQYAIEKIESIKKIILKLERESFKGE